MTSVHTRAVRLYDYLVLHPETYFRKWYVEDQLGMGHGSTSGRVWRVASEIAQRGGYRLTAGNPADENMIILTRNPELMVNPYLFLDAVESGVHVRKEMHGDTIADSADVAPGSDAAFIQAMYTADREVRAAHARMQEAIRSAMIERRRNERRQQNGSNGS